MYYFINEIQMKLGTSMNFNYAKNLVIKFDCYSINNSHSGL